MADPARMRRRHVLLGASGLLFLGSAWSQAPVGVRRVRGEAMVNGQPAKPGMAIRAGDRVTTGPGGELVLVVERDAVLVRQRSDASLLRSGLRLVSGAALAVFTPGQRKELRTPTATIGIRGTAVYLEVEPGRTYACTCYGEAVLASVDEPAAGETVRTRRHEQPRYVMPRGMPQMLMSAPVQNHTDVELEYLEGLVGRKPPS